MAQATHETREGLAIEGCHPGFYYFLQALEWIARNMDNRQFIVGSSVLVIAGMTVATSCNAPELCTTKDCNDRQIDKMSDLPQSILTFLNADFGGKIAEKGEPYIVGDAVTGGRYRSFMPGSGGRLVSLGQGLIRLLNKSSS